MKIINRPLVLMFIDLMLVNLALFGALWVRFDGAIPGYVMEAFLVFAVFISIVRLSCFRLFGLYNRLWQYASIGELTSIISAVLAGTAVFVLILFLVPMESVMPRGVVILDFVFNVMLIGGSRLAWRLVRDKRYPLHNLNSGKKVLIVGAGDGGVMVAKELKNHYNGEIKLVGFVDDDPAKSKVKVLGVPVLGTCQNLVKIVKGYQVEEVIIAMPSVEGRTIKKIVDKLKDVNVKVKILPGVFDLIEGNVAIKIRDVQVEDLLSREQVELDLGSICEYLLDKVVLVTGAGGSIGSELCRQIGEYKPEKLVIFDSCENNIYDVETSLKKLYPELDFRLVVKDVCDRARVEEIFKKYKPDVVFHAAAYKHVPLMEANPEEAIKNNVMGTYNVAQMANLYGANKFVLISSDKAVNPTSVMGASKRVAEMVIQYLNMVSETKYAAVRFGNVLGSRGSVIPLFKQQIEEGGPVTVTHHDMIRYFMTIPEAVQLVLQAGALTEDGELFILDMGEQVRIWELAETLIKLSGFVPGEDIEIVEVGIRPGEKLFEELLTDIEGVNSTQHERIFVSKPSALNTEMLEQVIQEFVQGILPRNQQETLTWLQQFLPEFRIVRHEAISKKVKEEVAVGAE